MIISFVEAADMSFRATLSVAVTIGGMMAATALINKDYADAGRLDLTRPVLWTAGPVRIDKASISNVWKGEGRTVVTSHSDICSNDIGLRIACALISSSSI